MLKLSVTEYAKRLGKTRQAVIAQIKENRLAKGVKWDKIGNQYVLSVRGVK
jgi:hypothetical protein